MTDHLYSHLNALIGERHPVTSPESLHRAQQYLSEQFRILGWEVTAHAFEAMGSIYQNVVAQLPRPLASPLPGPAPRTPSLPLIIAAHYDTVEGSPGADDNASGLAVLLEVARRVGRTTPTLPLCLIAFCLEEHGLLGSLAYARYLRETDQCIRGAIILECVGVSRSDPGTQHIPPGVPINIPSVGDFLGIVGNEDSAALVGSFERAANLTVPNLKTVSLVVPGQGELLPDTRRSDHAAFWQYGYPAVMLTDTADFRNPHYHQPTDTLETIDIDFLGRVTDAVTAAALGLSEAANPQT